MGKFEEMMLPAFQEQPFQIIINKMKILKRSIQNRQNRKKIDWFGKLYKLFIAGSVASSI